MELGDPGKYKFAAVCRILYRVLYRMLYRPIRIPDVWSDGNWDIPPLTRLS